jgi:Pyruvate/2-oxoacid:ferredoxin oxidoreductase gamma subunit
MQERSNRGGLGVRLDICVGGSGGQGVLLFGTAIIHAAVHAGKRAMCLPSYGAEARGGEVSCFVVFSDCEIQSPFAEKVDWLVFFNSASFGRFAEHIRPGVTLLCDATEVDNPSAMQGARVVGVPLGELAAALDRRCANMAMLGVFVRLSGILDFPQLEASFRSAFASKGGDFIDLNLRAIEAGRRWADALELAPRPGVRA